MSNPFTSRHQGQGHQGHQGRVGPMTANQRATLRSCMIDKAEIQGRDLEQADDVLDTWLAEIGADETNGFNRASKHIGDTIAWLKAHRHELRAAPSHPVQTHEQPVAHTELADGIYELPTGGVGQPRIVKVVHAVHGSGNQYAKLLDIETGEWVYTSGLVRDVRRSGTMLSLERARELGAIYGMCMNCGATLTDELSIALSIGPVCGKRIGGAEFTELARVTRRQLRAARVIGSSGGGPHLAEGSGPGTGDQARAVHLVRTARNTTGRNPRCMHN